MKIERVLNLAQISITGRATPEEERAVVEFAQIENVTNSEYLRARILLGIANANRVKTWLEETESLERDCQALATRTQDEKRGSISGSLERIQTLRDRVVEKGDEKTVFWLLQEVEAMIASFERETSLRPLPDEGLSIFR